MGSLETSSTLNISYTFYLAPAYVRVKPHSFHHPPLKLLLRNTYNTANDSNISSESYEQLHGKVFLVQCSDMKRCVFVLWQKKKNKRKNKRKEIKESKVLGPAKRTYNNSVTDAEQIVLIFFFSSSVDLLLLCFHYNYAYNWSSNYHPLANILWELKNLHDLKKDCQFFLPCLWH